MGRNSMQSLRAEKGRTGFLSAHERASGKILTPSEKRENCGKERYGGPQARKNGYGKKIREKIICHEKI